MPSVILGEEGALTVDKLTQPDTLTLTLRGEEAVTLMHPHRENDLTFELEAFTARCRGERGDGDTVAVTRLLYETLERVCRSAGISLSF